MPRQEPPSCDAPIALNTVLPYPPNHRGGPLSAMQKVPSIQIPGLAFGLRSGPRKTRFCFNPWQTLAALCLFQMESIPFEFVKFGLSSDGIDPIRDQHMVHLRLIGPIHVVRICPVMNPGQDVWDFSLSWRTSALNK